MTTEALIKPANIQEQLLGKISEMRQNLTAKQKQNIKEYTEMRGRSFEILAWRYFGISAVQIEELSDQELEALWLMVFERAQKVSVYMKILGYGIPVIGWIFILYNSHTICFTDATRKLRSITSTQSSVTNKRRKP